MFLFHFSFVFNSVPRENSSSCNLNVHRIPVPVRTTITFNMFLDRRQLRTVLLLLPQVAPRLPLSGLASSTTWTFDVEAAQHQLDAFCKTKLGSIPETTRTVNTSCCNLLWVLQSDVGFNIFMRICLRCKAVHASAVLANCRQHHTRGRKSIRQAASRM